MTLPSSRRTRVTSTLSGASSPSNRNEKRTPPRWSIAKRDRLVAVSSSGAPGSAGPGAGGGLGVGGGAAGAGERLGLGVGAAGGRMRIALRELAWARLPAQASTRPLCALIGTLALRAL